MSYLFTSESVSEGHPDKVADQISDAVVDNLLVQDRHSKIACETLVTRGLVVLSGEVRSEAYVDVDSIARQVIQEIGYNRPDLGFNAAGCGILTAIHDQSPDINRGVERSAVEEQGAGDQGMMFGYATNETENFMPLTVDMANCLLVELAAIRKQEPHLMPYLRPDAKSQVTISYSDDHTAEYIHTIVISTQHDEFIRPKADTPEAIAEADAAMQIQIEQDIRAHLIPRVVAYYGEERAHLFQNFRLLVNPTGKFVIGGPAGDTGLTGRKIIVDTYGGRCGHGGGAFSGKDPSKVDRSAAYAARHMAKNMVAAGVADKISVQLAYAIGVAEPISLFVDTHGTNHTRLSDGELALRLGEVFDLRPYAIEQRLKLREPIYCETAAYGHFGRTVRTVEKEIQIEHGKTVRRQVELFTWEKLDYVEALRKAIFC